MPCQRPLYIRHRAPSECNLNSTSMSLSPLLRDPHTYTPTQTHTQCHANRMQISQDAHTHYLIIHTSMYAYKFIFIHIADGDDGPMGTRSGRGL